MALSDKEYACSAGDMGLIPGSGKILWRRKWQPTPVFLPEKFHRQTSLASYSPRGCKESDTTEHTFFCFYFLFPYGTTGSISISRRLPMKLHLRYLRLHFPNVHIVLMQKHLNGQQSSPHFLKKLGH